jgi:hypothetical protein
VAYSNVTKSPHVRRHQREHIDRAIVELISGGRVIVLQYLLRTTMM